MTLHVEVTGNGPDIVLLHGWAMHGGVFAPLVSRLQERFRLHVVDLPGHGGSRESDIPLTLADSAQAIARVVPSGALWCGWSLGGLIALHAAGHPYLRGSRRADAGKRIGRHQPPQRLAGERHAEHALGGVELLAGALKMQ